MARYISDKDEYDGYVRYFNERLSRYIPERKSWTPVDEALFGNSDFYEVPLEEARKMQFSAIQFSFSHHYHNNYLYRQFCDANGFNPECLTKPEDMLGIPLIPDSFFKNHPKGKDFAIWLGNLCTGKLPRIKIKQRNPSLDQVVEAFNQAGLCVTYSSGTGGKHTFIPRDMRTANNSQYALAKSMLSMSFGRWVYQSDAYLAMPDPRINYLFAGWALQVLFEMVNHVNVAIKRKVSISMLGAAMGSTTGLKAKTIRLVSAHQSRRMIDNAIAWLEKQHNSYDFTFILGAPYLIYHVLLTLKKQGKSFCFGERGGVVTGGGWKVYENERLESSEFRDLVEQVLGIPHRYCLDVYGMVEGNGWMIQCPEGHYLHIPHSYFLPIVLDDNLEPVDYGIQGRFGFLDASALSYPGFILTGDRVRMLEQCPGCKRPGPVLEPEITRISGNQDRGCGEEVRRMFAIHRQE